MTLSFKKEIDGRVPVCSCDLIHRQWPVKVTCELIFEKGERQPFDEPTGGPQAWGTAQCPQQRNYRGVFTEQEGSEGSGLSGRGGRP